MKKITSILLGVTLMAALLISAPLSRAQAEGEAAASKANILLTFRISRLADGKVEKVKTYELMVADGQQGSRLLSGSRMPFPAAEGEGNVQQFVYHNVGFTTSVEAEIIGEKRILLRADLEDSRVREGEPGEPPIVETRQLSVNVVLTDGVPLALTRVKGLSDYPGAVEVEAIILE
jgi:hypothetical protein